MSCQMVGVYRFQRLVNDELTLGQKETELRPHSDAVLVQSLRRQFQALNIKEPALRDSF
jgi:hypothetical protein